MPTAEATTTARVTRDCATDAHATDAHVPNARTALAHAARRFGTRALALGAIVSTLLLPVAASAADGRLTLLFTGDNGGEVSPCG